MDYQIFTHIEKFKYQNHKKSILKFNFHRICKEMILKQEIKTLNIFAADMQRT